MPAHPSGKEGHKVCPRCREEKPLTTEYWYRNKSTKNGFNTWCKICLIDYEGVEENRLRKNTRGRGYREEVRYAVLEHYGGSPPQCSCKGCNVSEPEWLTIDHIDGGGCEHRRNLNYRSIYAWLYRNELPDGYQVLCMNCNHALGQYGYCPHQRKGVSTSGR